MNVYNMHVQDVHIYPLNIYSEPFSMPNNIEIHRNGSVRKECKLSYWYLNLH